MYHKTRFFLVLFLIFIPLPVLSAQVDCTIENRLCVLDQIVATAQNIDNIAWKDLTLREVAKTYAAEKEFNKAIELISKIETPDTKAMTIRGIGMELAPQNHPPEEITKMFGQLRIEAEKIDHPPSYAIALTYIAMAQAFAKDNEGAWKTASDMENAALRHKAFGETAEIQAEMEDFESARISIEKIDSMPFKNKAYATVSKILADKKLYNEAYEAAKSVTNPYKKAQSLQYILDAQKPRDAEN